MTELVTPLIVIPLYFSDWASAVVVDIQDSTVSCEPSEKAYLLLHRSPVQVPWVLEFAQRRPPIAFPDIFREFGQSPRKSNWIGQLFIFTNRGVSKLF